MGAYFNLIILFSLFKNVFINFAYFIFREPVKT